MLKTKREKFCWKIVCAKLKRTDFQTLMSGCIQLDFEIFKKLFNVFTY